MAVVHGPPSCVGMLLLAAHLLSSAAALHLPAPMLPRPPYRMWSFAYNATAGGPHCGRTDNRPTRYYCDNKTAATAVPADMLYPPSTYNLLNPAECFNATAPLAEWLNRRGVACMTWESCWQARLNPNTTNDSTAIAKFREIITGPAGMGATAIGLDECGDLTGPKWGHIPGDIPGEKKMALAAEGFRQGKKLHPHLFVAAWNPGSSAEPDGMFSGLMKDGTFDLAMFETYNHYPPFMISAGGEWRASLSLSLSLSLCLCLSVCLSLSRSLSRARVRAFSLSFPLSLSLSVSLCLCACLSLSLFLSLSLSDERFTSAAKFD